MELDGKGNSYFMCGQPSGFVPGGDFIFKRANGDEIFRVSDRGVLMANGSKVEDAGVLHKMMVEFFGGSKMWPDLLASNQND